MLSITGKLHNIYQTSGGVDKTTGKSYPSQSRIQIMVDSVLKNGSMRSDFVDLTIDDVSPYADRIGESVTVPVGAYVKGNAVAFYALASR